MALLNSAWQWILRVGRPSQRVALPKDPFGDPPREVATDRNREADLYMGVNTHGV